MEFLSKCEAIYFKAVSVLTLARVVVSVTLEFADLLKLFGAAQIGVFRTKVRLLGRIPESADNLLCSVEEIIAGPFALVHPAV